MMTVTVGVDVQVDVDAGVVVEAKGAVVEEEVSLTWTFWSAVRAIADKSQESGKIKDKLSQLAAGRTNNSTEYVFSSHFIFSTNNLFRY